MSIKKGKKQKIFLEDTHSSKFQLMKRDDTSEVSSEEAQTEIHTLHETKFSTFSK